MATYDLAGARVRYITKSDYFNYDGKYTQYRARTTVTTSETPTQVTVHVEPQVVWGKQVGGPQLQKAGTLRISATSQNTYAASVSVSTKTYGSSESAHTVAPDGLKQNYTYQKQTSNYTRDISISWGPSSGSVTPPPDGTYTIENTNDYSTGTGTSGSATSSGKLTITIPALASYSITYNANNGSGGPQGQQIVYYGQQFTIRSPEPTRSGYKFLGWSASSTATSATYTTGGTYTETQHKNLLLYAVWHQCPSCTYGQVAPLVPFYDNGQNYSVRVNGATFSDGATLKSLRLDLGSWSKTSTTTPTSSSPVTLSIKPTASGTFTAKLTITDSLNATTVYSLGNVVVKKYAVPSVTLTAERANSSGAPNDEGTYALITARFSVPSKDAYPLTGTTVTWTGSNDPSVVWYSTRNSNTKQVSGSVTWSSIANNGVAYALIGGPADSPTKCDVNTSYTFYVTPRDSRSTGTRGSASIGSTFYTIDFLHGGKGIAFGKAATKEGIECNMILRMANESPIRANITRKVSGGGGWAYTPFIFEGADGANFAHIGAYGSADEFSYIYIGAEGEGWNGNNLRIYKDGHIWANGITGNLTGNVTGNCSGSSGSCTGNAATATKATQDGSGNTITSTYLKLSGGTMTGTLTLANATWLVCRNQANNASISAVGSNTANQLFFGYGSYNTGVGASFFDGNIVNIRSKGNIEATAAVAINLTVGSATNHVYTNGYLSAAGSYSGTVSTDNRLAIASGGKIGRYASSSKRYKENIKNSEFDPHGLYNLPIRQFNYKSGYFSDADTNSRAYNTQVGFIAEEVQKYFPAATAYDGDQIESWEERKIIPPMLQLIQEQHKEIEQLKKEVAELKNK